MTDKATAIVVGVGPGLGAALVQKFTAEGMRVVAASRDHKRLADLMLSRSLGDVMSLPCDVGSEESVQEFFAEVAAKLGGPALVVFNASSYARGSILELTADQVERAWSIACLGGFLVGQAAARLMVPKGAGTIIFTGATASLRGSANFAPFAIAKFGLRALSQSMARELGPKGLHVAHVIIDGQIGESAKDDQLRPDAIAETYWQIHRQSPSAWTLEADLRPWVERF